jgi:hypothetical protein
MRLIPRRVQKQVRRVTSGLAMPIAVCWVSRHATRASVSLLRYAWNNDKFSADVDYLMAVAREAERVRGPILECGSGITTLLLGIIAQRRGIEVCTFEHDAKWWAAAKGVLDRCQIHSVRVLQTPLRSYGEFDWYTAPEGLPSFDLVICDGPPGSTRGGRHGLLPVMRSRLGEGCTILLDDAHRPEERSILSRWTSEWGAQANYVRGATGEFAVVRMQRVPSSVEQDA